MINPARFRDTQETHYSFIDEHLVVCPQCSACACVVRIDPQQDSVFAPRRLSCHKCGYTKDWQEREVSFGSGCDSYFGLPLWLQAPVGNRLLWAYNLRHLRLIEEFVQATLRERRAHNSAGWHNKSIISRLPDWIKTSKNRRDILKTIESLYEKVKLHQIPSME